MSSIVALVTARGGSKSVPRKNVLPLGDKPLIAWTIEAAKKSSILDRVILSTDDEEIAAVGQAWGAEVPFMRPADLAQDNSNHISVVLHALDWLEAHQQLPEYLLLLQPTSPFRTAEDIQQGIALAQQHQAEAVVGVCEAENHPFWVKRLTENGTLTTFVESDLAYLRRQELPPAYVINGAFYLNRVTSLRETRTFTPPGTYPFIMSREHSLDIDTPWDFYLAKLILQNPYDNL